MALDAEANDLKIGKVVQENEHSTALDLLDWCEMIYKKNLGRPCSRQRQDNVLYSKKMNEDTSVIIFIITATTMINFKWQCERNKKLLYD